MKTLLGLLLALLLPFLAACGDDGSDSSDVTAPDSSAEPSDRMTDEPSEAPTDPESDGSPTGGVEVVAIIDESNAKDSMGGPDGQPPVVLDTPQAIEEFAGRFTGNTLPDQVRKAATKATPAAGQVLVGAPVSLGCAVPTDVTVEGSGSELTVSAVGLDKKQQVQCLVPVLTVALVLVDESRVD